MAGVHAAIQQYQGFKGPHRQQAGSGRFAVQRFQSIAMDTCHKHHAAGQARFHGLEVRLGAQLITHDDLRVHAAQRHLDGLRFGAAGVDIAVYGVPRRQQLAALVRHAENAAGGIQIADDAAQESCFAAARRAYDQNPAIQGIQCAAKLGRQDTGHLARNAEIERCNIGKARRATHTRHPHAAAAGQGEIALFQLVLIGIGGVPAEGGKAAAQHARADGKGGLCCRQQLLGRLPGPAHRKLHRLPGAQADFLHAGGAFRRHVF